MDLNNTLFCSMMEAEAYSIPTAAKLFRKEDHSILYQNLESFGWSPVLVDANLLAMDFQHRTVAQKLLQEDVAHWETLHEKMFEETRSTRVTYRRAESGAPGDTIEPKQSFELVRPSNRTITDDETKKDDSVFILMEAWITIFHSVALQVARILEWPEGMLIGSHDDQIDPPPMDLLRAFLYEATPEAMGSSPHTDWGSLTIVWQDQVGGLETFCRSHNRWISVPPLPMDGSLFPLIVHIGDVTSLAMGKSPLWPSPLHRVRCSDTKRHSLVYFCYPPEGSLHDLQKRLNVAATTPASIDEACSLLQDQSIQTQPRVLPLDVYERILHQPLHDVFREKWAQVQR